MKFKLFAVALILSLNFIFINRANCQNQTAIKWLDDNSIKIKTVEAENGFEDLMPLKSILKDKRIVSLGEATHGTKEFFQMKHRMLEFLVKEMGFRYFAIEANLTEAYAVNEYVMYGKGDPQKALNGLYFWTWNTKEVLAMIHWMRNYNNDKPDNDKVRFYGFDMQFQPVAMSHFYQYLMQVDPTYAISIKDFATKLQEIKEIKKDQGKELTEGIESLFSHIDKNKADYISKTSKREFEIEKHNLVVVAQYVKMTSDNEGMRSFQIRDSCMAENVKWLTTLEGDSSKFVLWAHNGHISNAALMDNVFSMGNHLKKFYHDRCYALGFDFYTGSFQSVDAEKGLVKFNYELKQNSTGYFFSKCKNKMFLMDMANAENNPELKKIIHDTIPSISIGAMFSKKYADQYYDNKPLADMYDGLIFIRKTHRAEPNFSTKKNNSDPGFGNLMSKVNVEKYAEKQFKFSAYIKVGKKSGRGQLWARVDKKDKTMGFFDNMQDRPITAKEWQYAEITGTIDKDAELLYFGCMFFDNGQLFIDEINLSVFENGQWVPITIPDPSFESCDENSKPKDWRLSDKSCKISVTTQTSYKGKKCVMFKK